MAENLLSGRVVAIVLGDHLFDLLCHQAADRDTVFGSDDLRVPNRGLVKLNSEVSSGHPRILRGARKARQSIDEVDLSGEAVGGVSATIFRIALLAAVNGRPAILCAVLLRPQDTR